MYSTVTAAKLQGSELDGSYWYRNLREPVRFSETMSALLADGYRFFFEASPHPVLTVAAHDALTIAGITGAAAGALRRNRGSYRRLLVSLAELFVRGFSLAWPKLLPTGKFVELPTYAFQRASYWFELPKRQTSVRNAAGLRMLDHPILDAVVHRADGQGALFTGGMSLKANSWLADHQVFGTILVPGAMLVELALTAARHLGLDCITELTLEKPLALRPGVAIELQIAIAPTDELRHRSITISSRLEGSVDDTSWVRHATGTLGTATNTYDFDLYAWPPTGAAPLNLADFYIDLAQAELCYGPDFQGLSAAWQQDGDIFAEVNLPEPIR
ncbi:MAG TPA: polyketide synthase dehydratase domain-containing protein, partial [Polyangium sp.]|nr:polyketide synthase dehydratase domain-containing protein [Polyangium sp.]